MYVDRCGHVHVACGMLDLQLTEVPRRKEAEREMQV